MNGSNWPEECVEPPRHGGREYEGRGRVQPMRSFSNSRRFCAALLVGSSLGALAAPAFAQDAATPPAAGAPATPAPETAAPAAATAGGLRRSSVW